MSESGADAMNARERVLRARLAHQRFDDFLDEFSRHMDANERKSWFASLCVRRIRREIDEELNIAYRQLGEYIAELEWTEAER